MLHNQRAVVLMRGWSLPIFKPVASAEKSFTSPPPMLGNTAMVKNTIPIPPIQWVMERHSKMECGRTSMSVKAVAPVVVKPDMVSKKAAATRG